MATINVYLTKYSSLRGADIHAATQDELAKGLWFTWHEFKDDPDYVLVGTADVTVNLMPRADVVSTQIACLRKQQQTIRAESQAADMRIERQINSLLAIENAASEVQA